MNRRNALKALAGTLGAAVAAMWPRKSKAFGVVIPVRADTTEFEAALRRAMDDQLGIPPEPTGVIGQTYFKAGGKQWPVRAKCLLGGVDVTGRAAEADFTAGWCVLFDVDANGKRVWPPRLRVHRGRVEMVR